MSDFPQSVIDAMARGFYDEAEHLRHGGRSWDDVDESVRISHRGMVRHFLAAVVSATCPECGGGGYYGVPTKGRVECPTCRGTSTVHPLIDWLVAEQPDLLVDALKRGGVLVPSGWLDKLGNTHPRRIHSECVPVFRVVTP